MRQVNRGTPREFDPGEAVYDKEDEERREGEDPAGRLVVLAYDSVRAAESFVAATGKTVHEHNPSRPATDPVVIAAYETALNDAYGDRWQTWAADTLLYTVLSDGRVRDYSFPESRLESADATDAADAGGDDAGP